MPWKRLVLARKRLGVRVCLLGFVCLLERSPQRRVLIVFCLLPPHRHHGSPIAVVATKKNLVFSRDHSVADGLECASRTALLRMHARPRWLPRITEAPLSTLKSVCTPCNRDRGASHVRISILLGALASSCGARLTSIIAIVPLRHVRVFNSAMLQSTDLVEARQHPPPPSCPDFPPFHSTRSSVPPQC